MKHLEHLASPVSSNNCFNVLSSISFEDINFKIKMSTFPIVHSYFKIYKDTILNELRELTGLIKKDSNNVLCVISKRKKNELNKLFASTFKFSMTKQVSIVSELKKI